MLLSIVNCNTIMLSDHLSVMLRARIEGVPALSALEADMAVAVGEGISIETD